MEELYDELERETSVVLDEPGEETPTVCAGNDDHGSGEGTGESE